jgi:adenylate cyclase
MEPAAHENIKRRLAAVLAADITGYSRLIGLDEAGTLRAFRNLRAELFEPTIAKHNGRLVKTTGDGFLVEFSSVVAALRCATELQASMADRNSSCPSRWSAAGPARSPPYTARRPSRWRC